MEKKITVPNIGDFSSVEVIEILVQEGDRIEAEQPLLTLETEKATMEVPSPTAGQVSAIHITVGDKVSEGDLVVTLSSESAEPVEEATNEMPKATTEIEVVTLPDIGDFSAVEVIEIHAVPGQRLAEESPMISLETEKATMEVPAPKAGVVETLLVKVGDKISKGDPILQLQSETKGSEKVQTQAAPEMKTATSAPPPHQLEAYRDEPAHQESGVYAGPATRRLARELDIDLKKVPGTGKKGRISTADLHAFVKSSMRQGGAGQGGFIDPMPEVDFSRFGAIEKQPMSRINKRSAKNLHRNWVTIPHVTQFDEADITDLEQFRQENKSAAAENGLKLTPLVFIMKAVVASLRAFPRFNSSLSPDGETLILKQYYHIGVAVDTPNGLVVPVIRNVEMKSLFQLAKELGEVSALAREGKLSAEHMQGSCFSISSLGGIGGTAFTPIINAPDVAILGISRSQKKPVFEGEKVVPRLMLPLALSYDHRVIDGADAARFTTHLVDLLSNPKKLILT